MKNKTEQITAKNKKNGDEAENKYFTKFCDMSNIIYLHIDQSPKAFASRIFKDESKRPDFIISIPDVGSVFVDVKAKKKYPFYSKMFGSSFSAFWIDLKDYNKLRNLQERTSTPVWYAIFELRNDEIIKNTLYLIPFSRISKFLLPFHKKLKFGYVQIPDKCFYNWKKELEIKDLCVRCDDKICENLKLKEENGELEIST